MSTAALQGKLVDATALQMLVIFLEPCAKSLSCLSWSQGFSVLLWAKGIRAVLCSPYSEEQREALPLTTADPMQGHHFPAENMLNSPNIFPK